MVQGLARTLGWMTAGTALWEEALAGVDDASMREPSALAGWTRAHLVAHVAGNAEALVRLLDWARSGVETPMYPSREAREADIEAGSAAEPGELRARSLSTSQRLADAIAAIPSAAWSAQVRTAAGRQIAASEVPWMRVREVWIHAADLRSGVGMDRIPEQVAAALIDEIVATLSERGAEAATLEDSATGRRWSLAGGSEREVRASAPALLAWVCGRDAGGSLDAPSGLPALPAWL